MDDGEQISDYAKIRENNIAEFRALFKARFGTEPGEGLQQPAAPRPVSSPKRRAPRSRSISECLPTRRSRRINGQREWLEVLCYCPLEVEEETFRFRGFTSTDIDLAVRRNKFFIDREFDAPNEYENVSEDDDESFLGFLHDEIPKKRKVRNSMPRICFKENRRQLLSPEDISDHDIENIHYRSAGKLYDNNNGTTCHQCRQKTRDTKSICRNQYCHGVRGQFCGFCLLKRYGEDVADVLKDPEWVCPPCRNICNCSICRRRDGKPPTGILAPIAQERGYESVKDLLESVDK